MSRQVPLRLAIWLIVMSVLPAAPARSGSSAYPVLDSEYTNFWNTYRTFDYLVMCLAKRNPSAAHRVFSAINGDDFKQALKDLVGHEDRGDTCLIGAEKVTFGSNMIVGYLAEYLMRVEGIPPPPGPSAVEDRPHGTYSWTIIKPDVARILATQLTAACLVARYPAGASALLSTKPLSTQERRVFNAQGEQIASCVPPGGLVQLHPMVLRSELAAIYYRATHGAPADRPSSPESIH